MAATLFFGLVVSAFGELESDTLLQSTKVSPLGATHCLKIETDSGYYADGELTLAVDSGDGMVEELSDYYKQGSTVIKKCYQDVVAVEVSAGTNGWIGSILYSDNGGQSYSAMSCPTCSNGHSTAFIIVDGDTDATIIPDRTMCVDVLSKGPCRLAPTTMTAFESCKREAAKLQLPFSDQQRSNGAPAGCMRYNDGRVIYVKECSNHPNCGTTKCNGCKVLQPSCTMTAFESCKREAAKRQLPFSDQTRSNGAPAGCMHYNDGRVIYVKECSNHPNCGTEKCNGCKVLKPSCT